MCQIAPHCWDLAGCSLPGASRPFLWGLKSSLGSLNCCPSMERCFEGFALCPVVPVERNFPSLELPGLGIVVFAAWALCTGRFGKVGKWGNILGVLPKPLTQLLQEENLKMKEFYWKLGTSGASLQEQAAAKPSWKRDVYSHKELGSKNHPRCCRDCFAVFIESLFMNSWGHGRH